VHYLLNDAFTKLRELVFCSIILSLVWSLLARMRNDNINLLFLCLSSVESAMLGPSISPIYTIHHMS